jgi:tRNA(Ile)-lysidine synthase
MVLLDAAASVRDGRELVVATFDHETGPAATAACEHVCRVSADLRIECVAGLAARPVQHSEAGWRDARWTFLRDVARSHRARIATAHTADDQVETVLMRTLRDASARGLAGLLAPGVVLRPLLGFSRQELVDYARARGVQWVEDPTNESRAFLRNRVRHELLPALRRANADIDRDLLAVAQRAAAWRCETEAVASVVSVANDATREVDVGMTGIRDLDREQLAVVWPAVAARVGATLDRRGIARLASFSANSRIGARIQLSGGWEVVRSRDTLQLRTSTGPLASEAELHVSGATTWGRWKFWPGEASANADAEARPGWESKLPVDRPLRVRGWVPGDRLIGESSGTGRKVKQLLNDAGVTGHERTGWPVVLCGDRIVWIPGVRRSDAATARSGRPSLRFSCARDSG